MRYLIPLGRVLFSLIFILSAPSNFQSGTVAYAAGQGVPLASIAVPFSGLLALFGGLSVALGFHARWGAWLIVLFLLGVTPMMHRFWAVAEPQEAMIQRIMFLKNVSMLGAALLITQLGPGVCSLTD